MSGDGICTEHIRDREKLHEVELKITTKLTAIGTSLEIYADLAKEQKQDIKNDFQGMRDFFKDEFKVLDDAFKKLSDCVQTIKVDDAKIDGKIGKQENAFLKYVIGAVGAVALIMIRDFVKNYW
jgi:hypothetical protein